MTFDTRLRKVVVVKSSFRQHPFHYLYHYRHTRCHVSATPSHTLVLVTRPHVNLKVQFMRTIILIRMHSTRAMDGHC